MGNRVPTSNQLRSCDHNITEGDIISLDMICHILINKIILILIRLVIQKKRIHQEVFLTEKISTARENSLLLMAVSTCIYEKF